MQRRTEPKRAGERVTMNAYLLRRAKDGSLTFIKELPSRAEGERGLRGIIRWWS